jgi:hypothetical protein
MRKYDVHPNFIQVLLSFGEEIHIAEAGSSNSTILTSDEIESSCMLVLPEELYLRPR